MCISRGNSIPIRTIMCHYYSLGGFLILLVVSNSLFSSDRDKDNYMGGLRPFTRVPEEDLLVNEATRTTSQSDPCCDCCEGNLSRIGNALKKSRDSCLFLFVVPICWVRLFCLVPTVGANIFEWI